MNKKQYKEHKMHIYGTELNLNYFQNPERTREGEAMGVSCDLTHWGRDKWTPFRRRHFQLHFPEWKCLNSDYNITEICS